MNITYGIGLSTRPAPQRFANNDLHIAEAVGQREWQVPSIKKVTST